MEVHLAHGVLAVARFELDEVDVVIPVRRAETELVDPVAQHQVTTAPHDGLEEEAGHAANL